MEQPIQPLSVSLDLGIDVSVSEQGQGRGAAAMVNLDFAAEGDVTPRGQIERLSATAAVNVAPGMILPKGSTVPVSRRSSTLPLETACIARAASGARLYGAQAATSASYTLMALTCRDESATAVSTDDPNNFVELILYDAAGTVAASTRFVPSAPIADVKVTAMATVAGVYQFLLTYASPQAAILNRRVVQFSSGALTVGAAATMFSSIDSANWATSVHAVEYDATGLSIVVFTTASGTIRYVVVSALNGTFGSVVNTAIASTHYTEMASCHADDVITIATGYSSGTDTVGIYSFNDSTLSVTSHSQTFSTVTLSRRLAVVPDDAAGSKNVVVFVELVNGTDAILCNATVGILGTMGEMQSVRLADAGTWVEEDSLTDDNSSVRVPLIGVTSAEFVKTNFRSHVVARVFFDSVTALPRLSAAAIVAHSDAGMTAGRVSSYPNTRVGPLPNYAFDGGPTVRLPVLVVTRTTADRTIGAEGGFDFFGRAVRLTTITARASKHHGVVTLGPNTYVGGSVPSSWDGFNLTPQGFPLPPRTVKVEDNGVTVGGLPAGTFGYKIRELFQDLQGTIFESPVMFFGTAQRTNTAGNTLALTLYPSTVWTNMLASEASYRFSLEVFRNPDTQESGDTTFRKAYSLSHSAVASPVSVVDKSSAANISANELLPDAVTGALTAGPLPALSFLWSHRSRLFGIDAYDQELVRFTTEYVAPTAPRWADELSLRVTNSGGPAIGGASLADKLIVFQENQISVSAGEGPDGRGQGAFSYPESLRGVGALPGSQGAIVEVPTGVMFVHRTGIYHLAPDLSLSSPGSKLLAKIGTDEFSAVRRGRYLPSRAQVWFLTDGAVLGGLGEVDILVWDTTRSRWTTFSSSLGPFSDVIDVGGKVYLTDTRGRLLEAHSATNGMVDLDENGDPVAAEHSIKLPRVRADNAHQIRLRKLHISGQSEDVDVDVEVHATTHNESRGGNSEESTRVYTFDLTNQAASFQLALRAATQRCHSLQCEVKLVNPAAAHANDVKLSVLTYEISVLPGTGKVPVGKRPSVS